MHRNLQRKLTYRIIFSKSRVSLQIACIHSVTKQMNWTTLFWALCHLNWSPKCNQHITQHTILSLCQIKQRQDSWSFKPFWIVSYNMLGSLKCKITCMLSTRIISSSSNPAKLIITVLETFYMQISKQQNIYNRNGLFNDSQDQMQLHFI